MTKSISFFLTSIMWMSASWASNSDIKDNLYSLSEQEYSSISAEITAILTGEKNAFSTLQLYTEEGDLKSFVQAPYVAVTHKHKNVGVLILNSQLLQQKTPKDKIHVLQIPHRYHDRLTLDIGKEMFKRDMFDVMLINQEHRYREEDSDMSSQTRSLFNATAEGLMATGYQGKVIQLHGFAKTKRETTAAKQADIILSNGSTIPSRSLYAMQACLSSNFKLLARLYGREVYELGGTQNTVAKQINDSSSGVEFIHVELPLEIRELMLKNKLTTGIARCLVD